HTSASVTTIAPAAPPAPPVAATSNYSSTPRGVISHSLASVALSPPAGFALSQATDVTNGPMTASDFNEFLSDPTVAASLHFVSGYQVGYDSEKGSDRVRLTLLQFATSSDAQNFQSGFEVGS